MHELWATLFLLFLLVLIIGVLKPQFIFFWSKEKIRKLARELVIIIFGGATVIFFVLDIYTAPPIHPIDVKKEATSQAISTEKSKQNYNANQASQAFDSFYQDFKKYHSGLEESFNHLQITLDKTTKGEVNPADFYTFLKATDNLFLIAWSDLDKKSAPEGLTEEQKKEVNKCIKELAFSALTAKEAVEALMDGMENPNSIEARANFKNNIEKALMAHKVAGENIEKLKNELSVKK